MFPRVCLSQLRFLSKKSSRKSISSVKLIKAYNYENKVLFGAVKKSKLAKLKPGSITGTDENELASEMYWLLEHEPELPGNKTQRQKSKPKNIDSNPQQTLLSEILHSECAGTEILKAENDSPKIIERYASGEIIPFTEKGLKSIVRFPIAADDANDIPETTEGYNARYPSVGKILRSTLSERARLALTNWKLEKIKELGESGFERLQQSHLTEGKMLHRTLENYFLAGEMPHPDSDAYGLWKSVSPALEELQLKFEFAEKMVEHPLLKYCGVVDCVCTVGSETTIIEWKKSEKQKLTIGATFDAPLQVCAYLGALAADPRYKLHTSKAFVIVANPTGQPAQIHPLDTLTLQRYWQGWLQRLQEFWIRTRDGTLPEPI